MKKLFFILMLLFIGEASINAQSLNKYTVITLCPTDDDREIPDEVEGPPVNRSVIFQSAYAYSYNKVVSVSFEEVVPSATISIVNEATGETVYSEIHINPTNISIDLCNVSAGMYRIDIISDKISLQGSFSF